VRDSIMDRMRRHGGTAVLKTAPGEGTEVRLTMRTTGQAPGQTTGSSTEEVS
jgi:hypothetical protein